jgi:hypothetical protein
MTFNGIWVEAMAMALFSLICGVGVGSVPPSSLVVL